MLQVEYKLKIGSDDFTLKAEVADEREFFEKMSFYSNLPRTGPKGETDLKIVFRTTSEGYKYYSLVSTLADQEYKFGQNKDNEKSVLFAKGWEPLYRAPSVGGVSVHNTNVVVNHAPVYTAPEIHTSTPHQNTPQTHVVSNPMPTPTMVSANTTQVTSVANDVLARFGIKQG